MIDILELIFFVFTLNQKLWNYAVVQSIFINEESNENHMKRTNTLSLLE